MISNFMSPQPRVRSRRGFSLVVSLVMMALMLLIAITLVSFVYVQSRFTENKLKRAQAQINAVSGMRVALGQLQLLSGDDQRVTATGDIFGGKDNDSLLPGKAANGKRFWTGVWATGGLNKKEIRDWSIYSPNRKPFLGWLVSDYDSAKEVFAPNESPINRNTASSQNKNLLKVVQDDFKVDDEKLDLITLVGKGSLGAEVDASNNLTYNEREVRVRRVPLARYSASPTELARTIGGAFAYWVGDEGVKAKVNIPDGTDPRFVKNPDWNQLFNVVAQRNGVSLVSGLERFNTWWQRDAEAATSSAGTRLRYVSDTASLPVYAEVLGGGNASEVVNSARRLFHDVSFVSQGVFSDTYNGGLKTDLSLAFEMPWFSGDSWPKGFRDIKQFHGSGEKNNLNLLDISRNGLPKDPAFSKWWTEQPAEGFGYLYEIATGESGNRNWRPNHEFLRGPTWDFVRNYYRLYKREDEKVGFRGLKASKDDHWIAVGSKPYSHLSITDGAKGSAIDGTASGQIFGQKANYSLCSSFSYLGNSGWASPYMLTEFDGTKRKEVTPIIPQAMRVAPIVQRLSMRYSLAVDTGGTLRLCFDPVMVVHNPYNVPLDIYGFGAYWRKSAPFSMQLDRLDIDEATGKLKPWPGLNTASHRITRIVPMGHVFAFRFYAGTTDLQKGSSGVITMMPGEVRTYWPASERATQTSGNMTIIQLGSVNLADGVQIMTNGLAASSPVPKDGMYGGGQLTISEDINFNVTVEFYENAGDRVFNMETDNYMFNLFYPQSSQGVSLENARGVQRVWRMNNDMMDLSDENLSQLITVRKWHRSDRSVGITKASTVSPGMGKEAFLRMDIFRQAADENPLAGPAWTNPRASVIVGNAFDVDQTKRPVDIGWSRNLEPEDGVLLPPDLESSRWGDSLDLDGQSNIVLFEIPKAPLLSLGQLQHVDCSVFNFEPAYVIGNSYPNMGIEDLQSIFFWPDLNHMAGGDALDRSGVSPQPRGDTSFAANVNLFDRYFFSSINIGDANSAQTRNIDAFIRNLFSTDGKANPLANKRVTLIRDYGDRKEEDVKKDFYDPERVSRNLLLDGSFNINSTNVEAWKAVLSGLQGKLIEIDDKFQEIAEIPVVRFMSLIGKSLGGFGSAADSSGDEGSGWRWYAEMKKSDVKKLAEAIVTQVRERGPFMSMGDFVNRRLTSNDQGKAGALQAAIDDSKINRSRGGSFGDSYGASNPDVRRYPNMFPTGVKSNKAGIPGYVSQGDILANVGTSFSARSDTFTIRAYGDVFGIKGTPEARAWCEAVVQRMPEFFVPEEEEEGSDTFIDSVVFREKYRNTQKDELSGRGNKYVLEKWDRNEKVSSVNKLFGRRYKVISFRWLSENEI